MDKYEYKVRADEIKELIAQGEYIQAAEIADGIDWRRVKSVMMLCTISDLYKINRRYEDARDMLLLAYERRPGGRTICYSLCELSIKMEEFVQAVEYYKEYVQIAPKDPGRYILQYKLYEAQEVSLEERIEVLEELKKRDYRERWAYELAYLYHRVGLATRCVEECDELILWFGEGKYVTKAMELKMLHEPLTPQQQGRYEHRFEEQAGAAAEDLIDEQGYASEQTYAEAQEYEESQGYSEEQGYGEEQDYGSGWSYQAAQAYQAPQSNALEADRQTADRSEDMDIHVKTMDVGQYNTINLQAELAEGLKEVLGEEHERLEKKDAIIRSIMEPMMSSDTETLDYPEVENAVEQNLEPEREEMESSEVFFGETGELGSIRTAEALEERAPGEPAAEEVSGKTVPDITGEIVMEQMRQESAGTGLEKLIQAEPPKELAKVLSQETDGQISLVMPEGGKLEKQITGQMNIEDILAEWERMKKENEKKREEEVRRHVLQQTGSMFTEFEASVRDGLLEQLESGKIDTSGQLTEEVQETDAGYTVESEEEAEAEVPEAEYLQEAEAEEEPETEEEPEAEEPETEYLQEAEAEEEPEAENPEAGYIPVTETAEAIEAEAMEETGEPGTAEAAEVVQPAVVREKAKPRSLTREEKELYAPFIQSKAAREQLVKAIDGITMAAYTGNIIITGEEGMDTLTLAKNIIREVQMTDSNFSGKVAKISGQSLNRKDAGATLAQLRNGALIIQKASEMNDDTVKALYKSLQQETLGIIVVLEDTKKAMNKLLAAHEQLSGCFTSRMDVEALSNDMLVAFGRKYARELEYSIGELGILALHTRIQDMQTIDHAVTVLEVKEIVDEAIRHANKKTLGHFFDILFAKRYDDEDMIILNEKDFA